MPEGYALNWAAAIIAGAVGVAAMGIMFAMSAMLAPRRRSADKAIPYESGIRPAPYTWSQVHIRYYIFGILFLIFDVEAVFIFPWAVIFASGNAIIFYAMILFIAILFFGLVYAWKKGVLQWK